jgi:maleate isomerase
MKTESLRLGSGHEAATADAPRYLPSFITGGRLSLGVIIPSVNTLVELTFPAMVPDGVALHFTRLRLVGTAPEELLAMAEGAAQAARLLADAGVDRILFHCTAATTFDFEMPQRIHSQIKSATGVPSTVTSESVVAALRTLGAARIVMLTPYPAHINEREAAFLRHHGIDVVHEHGLNITDGVGFAAVTPEDWHRLAMDHARPDADAYFLSCAQTRTAEVIDAIEKSLGKPVITSNQAAVWHALRESGVKDPVPGFGRLMRS